MPEIGTSGLMSGDGKRGDALRQRSRPSSTLPVPTATVRVLFVFIVLSHDRRRVLHFNVTDHPSEEWTGSKTPAHPRLATPAGASGSTR